LNAPKPVDAFVSFAGLSQGAKKADVVALYGAPDADQAYI